MITQWIYGVPDFSTNLCEVGSRGRRFFTRSVTRHVHQIVGKIHGFSSGGTPLTQWILGVWHCTWRSKMIYPLVNSHKTMERSTMLLMGKSTISMAIFHSYVSLPEGKYESKFFRPSELSLESLDPSPGCWNLPFRWDGLLTSNAKTC